MPSNCKVVLSTLKTDTPLVKNVYNRLTIRVKKNILHKIIGVKRKRYMIYVKTISLLRRIPFHFFLSTLFYNIKRKNSEALANV